MSLPKGSCKMRKGQAAIEFILLVVVMLLFINTAIITNANTASDAALDVSKVGKARLAVDKLVNSINYVGFGGEGTKQTVAVFVPENVIITCNPGAGSGTIGFSVTLQGSASGCTDVSGSFVCQKNIEVYDDVALGCSAPASVVGPTLVNYTITKGSGSAVTVATG